MHLPRFVIPLVAGVSLFAESHAGGTVAFAEVEALLSQKPQVLAQLKTDYSLPSSGYAEVRLGQHFKNLSGARTGPYTFIATRRGQSKDANTKVLVCTQVQFISSTGQPLEESRWEEATRIRESVASVSFLKADAQPQCAR